MYQTCAQRSCDKKLARPIVTHGLDVVALTEFFFAPARRCLTVLFVSLGNRWFVFHISVVDPLSSCHCLRSCLDEIRAWSDLNPTHHIIFMDMELKLTGDFLRVSE